MSTLVDLLKTSAEKFGPSPALIIKPGLRVQRWSYDKLWDVSGQVASFLRAQGVEKGDRVILWAPNRPEWAAAFFGCLRVGAIVVPLDLRSAPDFVQRVVAQTEPRLAFLSRLVPQQLENPSIREVCLEDLADLVSQAPPLEEAVAIQEDDVVEILFTSGTTGDPKGAVLSHRNILSTLAAASHYIPGKPSYRLLSILPLSHVFEQCGSLFNALMCGASIVYPVSRQPTVIFRALGENGITTLLLVPQALQLFMNSIEREVEKEKKLGRWRLLHTLAPMLRMPVRRLLFRAVHKRLGGRLKFIVSGGAYLDPQLARNWENMGIPVVQAYGATEAPIISANSLARRKPGSVGKVLSGQEVVIAEDGEILVHGPGVFPGYWRAPQATQAAFKDGWYKTGDLGYFDEEGYLYLKGRKKDLIVLANGQNVYPEDIESVLRSHPAVADAVVVGLPKAGGEVQVHAVLLLKDGAEASSLIREANSGLADHQRIQGFTLWPEEDFPRSHTQKVKKHLVLEFISKAASERPAAPPTTPEAQEGVSDLIRIVAQISELSPTEISADKNLGDDLNIDSLGRVELLSAIEQELGIYMDERQVGPETTVAELERMLGERGEAKPIAIHRWPLTVWCTATRALLLELLVFPWLRSHFRVKVEGLENLDGVKAPVIFAANHSIRWDSLLILKALPGKWRRRVAYAKMTETALSRQWMDVLASLIANAFPLSAERVVRPSLEHMGKLLDEGWCVGIFPEGVQLVGADMQPFKSGTGLVAVECGAPVVPIRLTYIKRGLSWLGIAARREVVTIKFGRPLFFSRQSSYLEATKAIEAAIGGL